MIIDKEKHNEFIDAGKLIDFEKTFPLIATSKEREMSIINFV